MTSATRPTPVIPAQAGIQADRTRRHDSLNSRLGGNHRRRFLRLPNVQIALLGLVALLAFAAAPPAPAAPKASNPSAILPGSNSKEPISIDADKLVYYDKEQKAIYSGNVVAIQGDSKLTCSMLTIFLARGETSKADGSSEKAPAAAPASAGGDAPSASTSQVKRMEAAGPVTVVSKTQVATGDRGVYDKTENKVWLLGNVTLTDGGNVTKGDKLTYDLTTGQAVVETGRSTQRVHGLFIPNSGDSGDKDKETAGKKKLPDAAGPKQ
jgi:lipopolysaccharide export system protein LptA